MGTKLPLPKKGAEPPPNFGPCLLWPNGWMDQDGTWHGGGPWSRPHCARWGPSFPSQKGGTTPAIFGHFYCGQTAGCIKMALGMEVGLSIGDFVLDGDPAPLPKNERSPQFSADVYCGQTAAWVNMPVGTEVGLGLCDIVLDGDPAPPPRKGHSPSPIFGQCSCCDILAYFGQHLVAMATPLDPCNQKCLLWIGRP